MFERDAEVAADDPETALSPVVRERRFAVPVPGFSIVFAGDLDDLVRTFLQRRMWRQHVEPSARTAEPRLRNIVVWVPVMNHRPGALIDKDFEVSVPAEAVSEGTLDEAAPAVA